MARLMPRAAKAFAAFRPGTEMTAEQGEVLSQVIAKESRAAHSYNGFAGSIAYGYGLKRAVQSWFGHRMTTFEEVLGRRAHMGELTGEEVSAAAGRTFEPYHPTKAPFGQIEPDEAPELPVLPRETVGKALDAANQNRVVREYLFAAA